jgi:hypothetical protein
MAKMPFAVDLERLGEGQEQLLRLNLSRHPDVDPLVVGRELELFVFGRVTVGDALSVRYHRDTPVVLMAYAGHASIRTRWVDDKRLSRDFVFGTFTDRAELIVIPPLVGYDITIISGHSSVVGFRAWKKGKCGLDEVLGFPPGYDDTTATPPDRR